MVNARAISFKNKTSDQRQSSTDYKFCDEKASDPGSVDNRSNQLFGVNRRGPHERPIATPEL